MSCVRHRTAIFLLLATAAVGLAGCNRTTAQMGAANDLATASTTPVSAAALSQLGDKWQADPKDVSKGLAYANGLESMNQQPQALDVYAKLAELNPGDTKVAALYGRKLVSAGRASEAVPVLDAAELKGETDWRVLSALGTAYDQLGQYDKAREQYRRALAADPQNLSVLNNLAMSFALQGNLKEAEAQLRAASALPRAASEPRIRQNLALVVGLQGRFDEATRIAQQDLPPDQVQQNMAYLKKMLSQPNTWQQISDGGSQG